MVSDKSRVTLKTIAEACGYSVNTVSRAMRNDSRLPAQTVSKIQQTARELGYIQNRLASSLRSGHTNVIAVLVDNVHNPHYSTVITHMDRILRQNGYDIQLLFTNAEVQLEQHLIQIAVSNSVDGVILFPHMHSISTIQPLMTHQVPFVLVDRRIEGIDADVVRCDDYSGGYQAGMEFCRLGHRRFVYLAGDPNTETQLMRESGFLDALQHQGLSKDCVRIISSEDTEAAIQNDSLLDLLAPVDYTAILAYMDQNAFYALNSLRAAGHRVPEEISIIGFDNLRNDIPYLPPLTSIACSSNYDLANQAVQMLLRRIQDPSLPHEQKILPVAIHGGDTTACAAD